MQQSLAQMFNETAAAAYTAFPQELKKLVVLLVPSSDTPVYISPEITDQLTKSTADIKLAVEDLANELRNNGAVGLAQRDYDLAGTAVNMIALNENSTGNFSQKYTEEMQNIFFLDHEIGHHILKNGSSSIPGISPHLAESAADAYAMLRHIQRFGKKTDFALYWGGTGAYYIVLESDSDHYTTDAIRRAVGLAKEMDVSGLSLRETAALAEKIAAKCHPDDKTLEKIRVAYLPVHEICMREGSHTLLCREILSVMKKYKHDPDIFKAGKRFLDHPFEKKFMTESAKTDPYWKKALGFIDNHGAKARHKRVNSKSSRKPG